MVNIQHWFKNKLLNIIIKNDVNSQFFYTVYSDICKNSVQVETNRN